MDNQKIIFRCLKCGACCSQLHLFHGMFDDLDRGDGVCRHFNKEKKLCSIYDERPLKCRVEEGYQLFRKQISYEEYILRNKEMCHFLQQEFRRSR